MSSDIPDEAVEAASMAYARFMRPNGSARTLEYDADAAHLAIAAALEAALPYLPRHLRLKGWEDCEATDDRIRELEAAAQAVVDELRPSKSSMASHQWDAIGNLEALLAGRDDRGR